MGEVRQTKRNLVFKTGGCYFSPRAIIAIRKLKTPIRDRFNPQGLVYTHVLVLDTKQIDEDLVKKGFPRTHWLTAEMAEIVLGGMTVVDLEANTPRPAPIPATRPKDAPPETPIDEDPPWDGN